jgi:hypothetical protein
MAVIRFANFSRAIAMTAVADRKAPKPALDFGVVPVDQSLKARIASQRIPNGIKS